MVTLTFTDMQPASTESSVENMEVAEYFYAGPRMDADTDVLEGGLSLD